MATERRRTVLRGLLVVGQRSLAVVAQPEPGRELAADQSRGRAGEQDLAAVARVADPGRLVHRETDIPVGAHARLAGVEAHADAHLDAFRPLVPEQRPLRRRGGIDGQTGAAEDDEERVALGVDLDPAAVGEGGPQEAVVGREHVPVAVASKGREQPSRAFDIGEQEGHRARGQGC